MVDSPDLRYAGSPSLHLSAERGVVRKNYFEKTPTLYEVERRLGCESTWRLKDQRYGDPGACVLMFTFDPQNSSYTLRLP
jgi:hypothetical protein